MDKYLLPKAPCTVNPSPSLHWEIHSQYISACTSFWNKQSCSVPCNSTRSWIWCMFFLWSTTGTQEPIQATQTHLRLVSCSPTFYWLMEAMWPCSTWMRLQSVFVHSGRGKRVLKSNFQTLICIRSPLEGLLNQTVGVPAPEFWFSRFGVGPDNLHF